MHRNKFLVALGIYILLLLFIINRNLNHIYVKSTVKLARYAIYGMHNDDKQVGGKNRAATNSETYSNISNRKSIFYKNSNTILTSIYYTNDAH